jgi:hypothetical protein
MRLDEAYTLQNTNVKNNSGLNKWKWLTDKVHWEKARRVRSTQGCEGQIEPQKRWVGRTLPMQSFISCRSGILRWMQVAWYTHVGEIKRTDELLRWNQVHWCAFWEEIKWTTAPIGIGIKWTYLQYASCRQNQVNWCMKYQVNWCTHRERNQGMRSCERNQVSWCTETGESSELMCWRRGNQVNWCTHAE